MVTASAILLFVFFFKTANSQVENKSITQFDSTKIYALALDGNIKAVLEFIEANSDSLSEQNERLKIKFEQRFLYDSDKTAYPEVVSPIDDLIKLYANYWRLSLLNPDSNYDEMLGRNLLMYLAIHYPPAKLLTTLTNRDSIGDLLNRFLKEYLEKFSLYTTGLGRTGKLIDFLVWKSQTDTTYEFKLNADYIKAPVVMMDDFITLGWEEYATLGKYYPGGWTTKQSLFCVKKAYDLSSEDFLISYLAHEGQHFADYKVFPKLSSADLEYRAKLVELSLAKKTLYETIDFFITNANYNSNNPHSFAAYCVIRDLSHKIFSKDFVDDKNEWRKVSSTKINKTAETLLQSNTKALSSKGKNVERYIKP